jgi:hypothetical protein
MKKRKATCTGNSHFWMGDYTKPCDCGEYPNYDAFLAEHAAKQDAPPQEERRKTRFRELLEKRWNQDHHQDEL